MASKSNRVTKVRLDQVLAVCMFKKMEEGYFTDISTSDVAEVGCSWCTGYDSNINARVRVRLTGEKTVKRTRSAIRFAPSYTLAISDKYAFDGMTRFPQYSTNMVEIKRVIMIADRIVTVIARRYGGRVETTYGCEFEIGGQVTNTVVRSVLCLAFGTVG